MVAAATMPALRERKLNMITRRGKIYRTIDIHERVQVLEEEKTRRLLWFHNFTRADWGGKFMGMSRKSWMNEWVYLSPDGHPVLHSFQHFGETDMHINDEAIGHNRVIHHTDLLSEHKMHYPGRIQMELFRSRNVKGKKLPPTRGTLVPHIQRVNYTCTRDKSYHEVNPTCDGIKWLGVS